jgi:hypothetical protein
MDSEPSWNPGIHAVETVPVFEDSRVKGTLFFKKILVFNRACSWNATAEKSL